MARPLEAAPEHPFTGYHSEIVLHGFGEKRDDAIAPGNGQIAACGTLGTFVWNFPSLELEVWFPSPRAVGRVGWSPGGRWFHTLDSTGLRAEFRDAGTWEIRARIETERISGNWRYPWVSYSPDGDGVAIYNPAEGRAEIHSLANGALGRTFEHPVASMAEWGQALFIPGGRLLTYAPHEIRIWDAESGARLRTVPVEGFPSHVFFSPGGEYSVQGFYNLVFPGRPSPGDHYRFHVHRTWDNERIHTITGDKIVPSDWPFELHFADGGETAYLLSTGMLWKTRLGGEPATTTVENWEPEGLEGVLFDSATLGSDGQLLLHQPRDAMVTQIGRMDTRERLNSFWEGSIDTRTFRFLSYIHGGRRAMIEEGRSSVAVYDASNWTRLENLGVEGYVLAHSGAGSALIVADSGPDSTDERGRYTVLDINDCRILFHGVLETPHCPDGQCSPKSAVSAAFSPDGLRWAVGSGGSGTLHDNNTIILGDTRFSEEPIVFAEGLPMVTALTFSPDSKTLAAGFYHRGRADIDHVKLWEIESGEQIMALGGHPSKEIAYVGFLDGGRILAVSSQNTSFIGGNTDLFLWDAKSGEPVGRVENAPKGFALSPDGRFMLMGTDLYEMPGGGRVARLLPEPLASKASAISPNGRQAVTSLIDGTVRVWDLTPHTQPAGRVGGWESLR